MLELTQEFLKSQHKTFQDKSIERPIKFSEKLVSFLHTGFTLDMLEQVLTQKQRAFEAFNSRIEVFDLFMMNIKGSGISESLY